MPSIKSMAEINGKDFLSIIQYCGTLWTILLGHEDVSAFLGDAQLDGNFGEVAMSLLRDNVRLDFSNGWLPMTRYQESALEVCGSLIDLPYLLWAKRIDWSIVGTFKRA